jgi:hypothetical protein
VDEIPATGRQLSVPCSDIHTLDKELITATGRYWDQTAVARDLGLL